MKGNQQNVLKFPRVQDLVTFFELLVQITQSCQVKLGYVKEFCRTGLFKKCNPYIQRSDQMLFLSILFLISRILSTVRYLVLLVLLSISGTKIYVFRIHSCALSKNSNFLRAISDFIQIHPRAVEKIQIHFMKMFPISEFNGIDFTKFYGFTRHFPHHRNIYYLILSYIYYRYYYNIYYRK